jgi:hypothetical protein
MGGLGLKKQMILAVSVIISLFLLTVPMDTSANSTKVQNSDGSITYILGQDSSDQLIAVHTATAEPIWKIKTPGIPVGSLFIIKGNIIFIGMESNLGTPQLVALDPSDGRLLWRISLDYLAFDDLLLSPDMETLYLVQLSKGEQICAINMLDRSIRWTYSLRSFGKTGKLSLGEHQTLIFQNNTKAEVIDPSKISPPVIPVFSDIEGHWAKDDIFGLTKSGVISGFTDGTFRPENTITREQAVKLLLRLIQYPISTTVSTYFSDISKSRWSNHYIQTALELGLLNLGSKSFSPEEPMSREEMSVMVCKILQLPQDKNTLDFNDMSTLLEDHKGYIGTLVKFGIITGFEDNTFRPKDHLTRAQSVAIMSRILQILPSL